MKSVIIKRERETLPVSPEIIIEYKPSGAQEDITHNRKSVANRKSQIV